MSDLFSREHFSDLHFSNSRKCQNVDMEAEYQSCTYKISIPLTLEDEFWPRFSSITIDTVYQGKSKSAILTQAGLPLQHGRSCYDMRKIGEFIFLLAAKDKHDLLQKVQPDKAGFLHTEEIKELKKNGRTNIGKQVYRSISQAPSEFLSKFLFDEKQLYHLLGYQGKTTGETDLLWWLNVSPDDIEFKNGDDIITGTVLKKHLNKLFPQACLLSGSRKKDFYTDHILEDSDDTTSRATENDPAIIPTTDHRINEFRNKLKDDALVQLNKKLYDRPSDYQPLGLEIGLVDELRSNEGSGYDHNRAWGDFEYNDLKEPEGFYIISSETGSGKTTFLRDLQLTIINDTDLIPIFLEASSAATLDYRNSNTNNFLEGIAKLFNGYLQSKHEYDFLQTHLDKIVFLIDGLDQIAGSGTEYKNLIDKLTGVIEDKLIIASRPFAVIDKEKDSKIKFLRLKPFSEEETGAYFGKMYDRAKELCRTCPEMIHIPMLAYMVRILIDTGEDKDINNRAQLYGRFIKHIFENYIPSNLNVSFDDKEEIPDILRGISFKAIAREKPHFQKIPYRFAKNCLHERNKSNNIEIETLLKVGLPDTIVNQSGSNDRSIYFSHLSFQEYLAAEYVSQDDNRIQQVLAEKWNPNWKEVIKFLVGIKGQEIIEKILSERDNPIHSKLFLSSELVPEVDVSSKLKTIIIDSITELLDQPLFSQEAWEYWAYVNEKTAINYLVDKLKDESVIVRCSAIDVLVSLQDKVDSDVVSKIVKKLDDEHWKVRDFAIRSLWKMWDKVDSGVVLKIVDKLEDKNVDVVISAIGALSILQDKINSDDVRKIIDRLKDVDDAITCSAVYDLGFLQGKIGSDITQKYVGRLEDDNPQVVSSAIYDLRELHDKVDFDIVKRIVEKLEDENGEVRSSAIYFFGTLHHKVDSDIVKRIVGRLEDEDGEVRRSAIDVLGTLHDKIDSDVVKRIVGRLEDKDMNVRDSVITALCKMEDKIDSDVVRKIVEKLDDEHWKVRKSVICSLGKMKDKVNCDIVKRVVEKLEDEDGEVRRSAIYFLRDLHDKADFDVVKRIVEKFEDKDAYVRLTAIWVLEDLHDKVDFDIAKRIVEKFEDKDAGVRLAAICVLGILHDKVDFDIVKRIVEKLEDEDAGVRSSAIDTLEELNDKVDSDVVKRIVGKLEDEDMTVRHSVTSAIMSMQEKLDNVIIRQIVSSANENAYAILKEIYQYGKLEFLCL